MSSRTPVRRRSAAFAAAVALLVALAAAAPASAAWQVTTTPPVQAVTAGTLATPALTCTPVAVVPPRVTLSWTGDTKATGYTVQFGGASGPTQTTTATSLTVTSGLLGTLLGTLLGSTTTATVAATNGNWSSPKSNSRTITIISVLAGGGVTC